MKPTSLALALAVPAVIAAAETPATQPELKDAITAQARMEFSMLAMQYPAPTDRENTMAQIAYIFELCHAANNAVTETAAGITSKETADAKAMELGGRVEVYMELCIAAAFTQLNADKLTDDELKQLEALSNAQNSNDSQMAAEMRRLEANAFYGSAQLKAVMDHFSNNAMQGVQVEASDAEN